MCTRLLQAELTATRPSDGKAATPPQTLRAFAGVSQRIADVSGSRAVSLLARPFASARKRVAAASSYAAACERKYNRCIVGN